MINRSFKLAESHESTPKFSIIGEIFGPTHSGLQCTKPYKTTFNKMM